MARPPLPQVVTGNALVSGRVVWLAASGWSYRMAEARVFHDPDQAAAALAGAQAQSDRLVGCYLTVVRATPQGPEPTHFREAFRMSGPSAAARVPG